MAKMRFEIRKDIHDTIDLLERLMTKNGSVHMSMGYLKATLVETMMELPPAKRDMQLRVLRSSLSKEIEHDQDKKDAA